MSTSLQRLVGRDARPKGTRSGSENSGHTNAARLPVTWAKPADEETVWTVRVLREVCEIAWGLGWSDEMMATAISRQGRHISVHTFRSWREPHRSAMVHFADIARLVRCLPEEAVRPLVEAFAEIAGMAAIDLPELGAGAGTLHGAALDVAKQTGELAGAIAEAAADGQISGAERALIRDEALDVVRSAAWCGESA